jgi:hypothetical protein
LEFKVVFDNLWESSTHFSFDYNDENDSIVGGGCNFGTTLTEQNI